MGPTRASPESAKGQGAARKAGGRRRRCLLKGCTHWFVPVHSRQRYCDEACQQGAAGWRRWKAARQYRATDNGKERRKEQSRRRRVRRRSERRDTTQPGGEGHRKDRLRELLSCDRPGCYELFLRSPRSPLQRFCSFSCRKALRRVELREARALRNRRRSVLEGRGSRDGCVTHIDRADRPP